MQGVPYIYFYWMQECRSTWMEVGKEREKDRRVSLGDVLVCLGQ